MKARTARAAAGLPPPPTAWRRLRRRIMPRLRRGIWWAVPIVLVAGTYTVTVISRIPEGQAALAQIGNRVLAMTAGLGLVVENINVAGRETTDIATIKSALAADRGTPILGVSPTQAKQQLETLPWVRSAAIERRLPNTIFVRLVERRPLAVWQHQGKMELIDRDGEVMAVKDLSRFAKLPTVVGDDANKTATALVDMLAKQPELAARVTAAVRVDGRRWNVRIDNAIDVLLPEEEPADAWNRLAALDRTDNVLKRDLQTVDLRLPDRLVLRVATPAPATQEAAPKKPHPPGKNT